MAVENYTGLVFSDWGSSALTQLISGGVNPNADLRITQPSDPIEFFPASATRAYSGLAGLGTWTVGYSGNLGTNTLGANSAGTVTFSNGTVLNLTGFNLAIAIEAIRVTTSDVSTGYHSFIPGAIRWSGSWQGYLDSAAVLEDGGAAHGSLPSSAEFRYGSTANHKFTGTIVADYDVTIAAGQANQYVGNFRGVGDITHGTTGSAAGFLLDGVVSPMAASALVLSGFGATYFSGAAFPTNIGVTANVGEFVSVDIAAQGTGALTKA